MLTSTHLRLRARAPGELPDSTGRFGHAAFLALIESVTPELSQALHDNNGRQPFTVSPLRVAERARANGGLRLREGDSCAMRFTILHPTLFQSFQQALMSALPSATIQLQNIPFAVEEAITSPQPNLWTGYTTFAELLERAPDQRTIALRFDSPTALSLGQTDLGKRFELFPAPWNVFDSLARKWSEFSEIPLDIDAVLEWVQEFVWVSEHEVRTQVLRFDRFSQKGFAGQIVYEIKRDDAEPIRILNALADFALYAGVGYKTTMGMGQCRRISDFRC
ncbi:MAG: CRISPR-associated endoribonuclease Cas6 [Chloroflexi bacterium]|nr:CRISPR-associated endoribonuclease Cas6 [Chloroflexota bacterium]